MCGRVAGWREWFGPGTACAGRGTNVRDVSSWGFMGLRGIREDFGAVWGGCGEDGGWERIWSGLQICAVVS